MYSSISCDARALQSARFCLTFVSWHSLDKMPLCPMQASRRSITLTLFLSGYQGTRIQMSALCRSFFWTACRMKGFSDPTWPKKELRIFWPPLACHNECNLLTRYHFFHFCRQASLLRGALLALNRSHHCLSNSGSCIALGFPVFHMRRDSS